MHRRWVVLVWVGLAVGCATQRKDVTGSGDDRLDEASGAASAEKKSAPAEACGAEGKGNLVLLDARTATRVSCALVTVARVNAQCLERCRLMAGEEGGAKKPSGTSCPDGSECPTEPVFNGRANKAGQILIPTLGTSKLTAVVEGYAPTLFDPSPPSPDALVEVELLPEGGFLLKLVDDAGNYLPDRSATFKQGENVLAQLRSNELANVFFPQRTPFAGDPVTVEVEGFQPAEIRGPEDLGSDGHTLALKK